jgi:hypothetical protein
MHSQIYISIAKDWLKIRTHRERIVLLFVGWACIYLFWNWIWAKPLAIRQIQLTQEIQSLQTQITQLEQQEATILLAAKNPSKILTVHTKTTEQKPLNNGSTIQAMHPLIKSILNQQANIKFLNLTIVPVVVAKDSAEAGKNLQLGFNSDYFNTIIYLNQLEKLPWCLSWDSLEYKVINYPQAEVVVTLHIA